MQQNFSQRLQMQIPQENTYTGIKIMSFNDRLKELSDNYTICKESKLKEFIEEHINILDFIFEITPLINDYFPTYQKIIELCEDPEFSELDFVMIYIKGSSFDADYEILRKFENESLYQSKFSKNINGLVCVGLW